MTSFKNQQFICLCVIYFWLRAGVIGILINVQKCFMRHLRIDVGAEIPWSQA